MLDGSVVASGVLAQMVSFVGDAWPIVLPMAGIGVFALVVMLVRSMSS